MRGGQNNYRRLVGWEVVQSRSEAVPVQDRSVCGPFSHPDFTPPSSFMLENSPYTIEAFVSVNELQLTRTATHSPVRQNITQEEHQALLDLQNNKSIVIRKADKGSAIVIQDIEDYRAEGCKQLSDDKYYRKVESDLTIEHSERVNAVLTHMLESGKILSKTFENLFNDKPRTSQFYLLPKVHKRRDKPPGCPIVSANECPTESITQFVDFFLQPLLHHIRSHLKDTTDLINVLIKIKQNDIIIGCNQPPYQYTFGGSHCSYQTLSCKTYTHFSHAHK